MIRLELLPSERGALICSSPAISTVTFFHGSSDRAERFLAKRLAAIVASNPRRAMEEPLRQIVANAGGEPSVVVAKVREGSGNFGYNAATDEYGDMIDMGILDPTKVTRYALQNAASIAGLMITTEAMIADKSTAESQGHGGGMPDMGGMM